jgi:hypothetical protein
MHPCITDPQQREVRKLSVSPTSPKESQRQDVPFVLEPSLLKFEDLQDPRTRATDGPMPWPARWRLWPPHHLPEWISQVRPASGAHGPSYLQGQRRSEEHQANYRPPLTARHARKEQETTASRPRIGRIPASPSLLLGRASCSYSTSRKPEKCQRATQNGLEGDGFFTGSTALLTASRVCSSKLH